MTNAEFDVLTWLADELRPVSHLLALSDVEVTHWIRSHGGRIPHTDAVITICEGIRAHYGERIDAAENVIRLNRSFRHRQGNLSADSKGVRWKA